MVAAGALGAADTDVSGWTTPARLRGPLGLSWTGCSSSSRHLHPSWEDPAHPSLDCTSTGRSRHVGTAGPGPAIRPRAEIASFFDGLDMVSPGMVQIDMWRPFAAYDPDAVDRPPPIYAGVARKQ